MSKNTATLVKKITENVSKIKDDEFLTALLIMVSKAAKDPIGTKAKIMATPKPKTTMKAPTKIATESHILEYQFKDKAMVAIQTNGKPDDDLLETLRAFRAKRMMSYYGPNIPFNPFNNKEPFWAGPACDEVKNTLMAIA
jgi:hypothetical protein